VVRPYAELDRSARDKMPFSNSTEGEAWLGKWCERCANDQTEDGCPLVLIALCGKTPREWEDTTIPGGPLPRLGDRYRCTEFRKARRPKQEPPGEIPGQLPLFPEEA
jgi:hypothetical protein